jgi:DNA-directed RNA polymerase specialized sigma24 family protein
MAYGCALSILGDPELAEDAAQNAFLTTYFTLHKINKPVRLPPGYDELYRDNAPG